MSARYTPPAGQILGARAPDAWPDGPLGPRCLMYRRRLSDGAFDYVAPGLAELLGLDAAALLAPGGTARFESRVHPDDLERGRAQIDAAARGGGTAPRAVEIEWRLIDAAGAYRWVCDSMTLFPDTEAGMGHIVGAIVDLTAEQALRQRLSEAEAWREAEGMLKESETRYALAMRGTNEGLWDWNPLSDALFLSSRLLTLLGVDSDHLATTSRKWLERVHTDDRPHFRCTLVDHLKGRTPHFECEYRVLDQHGDYRWVVARGLAQRGANGMAYRMVGSIGDITERKRAEARLKSELEFTRTVLNSLPVALLVLHPDGRVVRWNRYFTTVTGTGEVDVGEPRLPDVIAPQHKARIARVLEQTLAKGEASAQAALRAADGSLLSFEFLARRIETHDGERILCIASDISERQRAETAMRDLNRELESRVQERTAELASALKELETFSYSVSHDLRAPLRAIDGYSAILSTEIGDKLDDETRQLFERMRSAVQRMGRLIDDLLNLARVSRRTLERSPVNLSALVQEIGQILAYRHPERRVALEIAPNISADVDPNLARIALENLLDNAWKFTAREPDARVRFGYMVTDDGEDAFYIQDNGAGFDMRYVHKLFVPFQRLHHERDFPGTGVGLATVARIVQRHGGRAWAQGGPGEGATFFFTLAGPAPRATSAAS